MAVSTPKINEIRARLLKIGDNGPLGTENQFPGSIFVALGRVVEAGAVEQAPGSNFGRTLTKNQENLKYIILPTGP